MCVCVCVCVCVYVRACVRAYESVLHSIIVNGDDNFLKAFIKHELARPVSSREFLTFRQHECLMYARASDPVCMRYKINYVKWIHSIQRYVLFSLQNNKSIPFFFSFF